MSSISRMYWSAAGSEYRLSTGTLKKPWICEACRSMVCVSGTTYNDVVTARRLEHVGNQARGNRRTALVLLVLARVEKVRDHRGNAARARRLARADHDQQLHQRVVRADRIPVTVVRHTRRVQDVHVVLTHRLVHAHHQLARIVLAHTRLAQRQTQPASVLAHAPLADQLRQLRVTRSCISAPHVPQKTLMSARVLIVAARLGGRTAALGKSALIPRSAAAAAAAGPRQKERRAARRRTHVDYNYRYRATSPSIFHRFCCVSFCIFSAV